MDDCRDAYRTLIEPKIKIYRKTFFTIFSILFLAHVILMFVGIDYEYWLFITILNMGIGLSLLILMYAMGTLKCPNCDRSPIAFYLLGVPVFSNLFHFFGWPKKCIHCNCVLRDG